MESRKVPLMITSVAVPDADTPGQKEPIVVTVAPNPIAFRIRDALLGEPLLGGAQLEVHVVGNTASISGEVRSDDQKDLALRIAGRYVGRDHVRDDFGDDDES